MVTEQLAKHVRLECNLSVGEVVKLDDDFGYKYKGRETKIMTIKRSDNYQSGFMVTVDIYGSPIDSDWIVKLQFRDFKQRKRMKREPGFYWVKWDGLWMVAEYAQGDWYLTQRFSILNDIDLEEIDERKIERTPLSE